MKKITMMLKKKFKNFNPKIKEECGVFGISNIKDASALTALGLHALQHRGQEGCGIVSFDGDRYHSEKRFGLVGDNFNKEKVLKNLAGKYALGHNRYSTTGGTTLGSSVHGTGSYNEPSSDPPQDPQDENVGTSGMTYGNVINRAQGGLVSMNYLTRRI